MDEYFGYSPEAVVDLLYRLVLGREADPDGRQVHVAALRAAHISPEALAREMIASEEYQHRNQARESLIPVAFQGCQFMLPAGADVVAEFQSPEGYEPWVLPYFLDRCRPGMTVVDVGASWGAFALPAARRVGETGKIIALEVSPYNCQILLKSVKASGLGNVKILPLGVSDRLGSELLRQQQATKNNNAISTGGDAGIDQLDGYDVVAVAPIDLLRSALGPVHVLKMDIEGMEYRAAIGGLSFLREQKPLVFLEYSPEFQRVGSSVDGSELLRLFLDLGYDLEVLHRHAPREMILPVSPADQIARVHAIWRSHVQDDQGTHLDLCLHPRPL
jgi:FkbM family methyltransferase